MTHLINDSPAAIRDADGRSRPDAAARLGMPYKPIVSVLVAVGDIFAIIGASAVVYAIYVIGVLDSQADFLHYAVPACLAAFSTVALAQSWNWYDFEALGDVNRQFRRAAWAFSLVVVMLLSSAFLTKTSAEWSRGWLVGSYGLAIGGMTLVRAVAARNLRRWREAGRLKLAVLIIGSKHATERLAERLLEGSSDRIHVVGCYVDEGADDGGTADRSTLGEFVRARRPDQVVIAVPWHEEARVLAILDGLRTAAVSIRLAFDLDVIERRARGTSSLGGVPLLRLSERPLKDWQVLAKRVEDLILCGGLMVIHIPVMLLIALLIKLDSPGPILFRQARHGFNNSIFWMLKFRTMHVDQSDPSGVKQTVPGDPRVTRVGAFLRRWSFDELPQFLNVLRGEMSLVGPRAHPIEMRAMGRRYDELVDDYAARHRVKPGLTGWAQVNGWRGPTLTEESARKRIEYDLDYIENWSLLMDLKIIGMTVFALLSRRNAH